MTAVEVRLSGRERLRIDRPDGYLATLARSGMPDRQLPLKRRELGDLLAEELRRLDADQPYADALAAVTGAKDLDERPAFRTLIWRDPAKSRTRQGKRATGRKDAAAHPRAVKKATSRKATATKKAVAKSSARSDRAAADRRKARGGGSA